MCHIIFLRAPLGLPGCEWSLLSVFWRGSIKRKNVSAFMSEVRVWIVTYQSIRRHAYGKCPTKALRRYILLKEMQFHIRHVSHWCSDWSHSFSKSSVTFKSENMHRTPGQLLLPDFGLVIVKGILIYLTTSLTPSSDVNINKVINEVTSPQVINLCSVRLYPDVFSESFISHLWFPLPALQWSLLLSTRLLW